jgi:LysM repeat protein
MRLRAVPFLVAATVLAAPSAAFADFVHVVAPGESLSSIAAVDGLTVDQLAAANGLPADALLIAGSAVQIPPQMASVGSFGSVGSSGSVGSTGSTGSVGDGDADADDGASGSTSPAAAAPPAASTAYVVQPGDTLSAIAARAGTSVAELAAVNGLDPNGLLLSGSSLTLSGSGSGSGTSSGAGSSSAATSQPVGPAAEGSPGAPPYPTQQTVTSDQVGQIAAANGVPPSLAEAVGYQESGFNNGLVSVAGARGVMQILPGTWDWVQRTLTAGMPLDPASATDNIRGGVLLLRSLLDATGGDPALAAAGYYQGLPSVRQNGLFPDTQQYVNSVLALQGRFGG